ncbi:TRAP transporter substrate-binding protein [Hydrogenophaga sp. SNF1]|uniref:TRAP transporter substrate-binding protein n=1 Tax=Hydrogenophaga sp. SNF1 TaxID=3098762 RepID=UPI002ACC0CAD|nr:TRAP transporter substrate-binding protein [Hydrogenophaga sp. SNF1]WQB83321.1 TRAP transporter substrate-binding protein [Hydrogenophaga sp. SNF1]
MIRRRSLLKTGAAAAVAGPIFQSFSQQAVSLRMHTFMAPTSNVWTIMLKPWMDKVEKESGGRIRFEGYPAMQLGGTPPQLYDQARDGVADIVWTLPGYTPGRFVRGEVFELPFMMNEAGATSRAYWEFIQTQAPDEFKDTKVLALHVHGRGSFHSTQQIKTVADLKGMKLRAPTRLITRLLAMYGAVPVGMPLPGIPDALSKGTIQGVATAWDVVPSVKVHELTKYSTEFADDVPAFYTGTFVMAMNRAKYESLPPDLKKVIDANSGIDTSAQFGTITQSSDAIGRKAVMDRGNPIYTIPKAEAAEFIRLAGPLKDEWVADMNKRGYDGQKLLASAKSLIAKYAKT